MLVTPVFLLASLCPRPQDTAANPEGAILENVPATVIAPVPGPPDFNGASAVC